MAIKTFTAGSVLTASDTNTYLANSGLVYIKSQTVGTGVSTVNVTSAFSADYDNYRIVYTGGVSSTANDLTFKLGATATGYYYALLYSFFNGTTPSALNGANQALFNYFAAGTTNSVEVMADIRMPYLSKYTHITSLYAQMAPTGAQGTLNGFLANTTSYTDFTLATASGTITGGTITVYGYRKA